MKNLIIVLAFACIVFCVSIDDLNSQEAQSNPSKANSEVTEREQNFTEKLAELAKMLESDNDELKIEALDEIIKLDDTKALPLVIKALSDKNENVREKAAFTIKYLPRDESVVEALIKALDDTNVSVRWVSAEILGELKEGSAVPKLIEMLSSKDHVIRNHVQSALGRIGKPGVELLIAALKIEDDYAKSGVCYVLGIIGDKSAVPALIDAVEGPLNEKDNRANVKYWAIFALGKIGDDSAVATLSKYLSHENRVITSSAAEALGKIGGLNAINALKEALENNKNSTDIIRALGDTKSKSATLALLEALKSEKSAVRSAACYALMQIGDRAAIPSLLEALKDKESNVRMQAFFALVRTTSVGLEKPLRNMYLNETDSDVKHRIAVQLIKMNAFKGLEDEMIDLLLKQMIKRRYCSQPDIDNSFRYFGNRVVPKLIEAINDDEKDIKAKIIDYLGDFNGDQVVNALTDALLDENDSVKYRALESLGKVADERAVPALEKFMVHAKDRMLETTATCLFKIGGEKATELIEKIFDESQQHKAKVEYAEYLVRLGSDRSNDLYDYIVESLKSLDKSIRIRAIWALGEIGDNKVLPEIIKVIKEGDIEELRYAIQTLNKIGDFSIMTELIEILETKGYEQQKKCLLITEYCRGEADIDLILSFVNDEDEQVRRKALSSLQYYKNEKAVKACLDILKTGTEEDSKAALWTLGEVGNEDVIDTLIEFTTNDNDEIRRNALSAIGKIKSDKSCYFLISALNDKDETTRHYSALSIGRNKYVEAKNALEQRYEIETSLMVKVSIAGALVRIGADKDGNMINFVIDCIDKKVNGYQIVGWLLGEIADKRTVPALIKNLDNCNSNLIRDVADALAIIGDKSAIPAMVEAYENASVYRKRFARVDIASAIAALGDKRGITYLFNELQSTEYHRRSTAINALGKYGEKSIIPQLEAVVNKDHSFRIRKLAEEAIKEINERQDEN